MTAASQPAPHRGRLRAVRRLLIAAVLTLAGAGLLAQAATASVAAFSRIVYSENTSGADAATHQYRVMTVGYSSTVHQLIAAIHASDPGVRVLMYKNYTASPNDPNGYGGCVGWNSSQPHGGVPLSWFVRDASGAPIYSLKYGSYELDPGNTQVQQACLSSAITLAKANGYDGVLWDSINPSLFWAGLSASNCSTPSCFSDGNWHAAIKSYVVNLSAGLHAQGLLSLGNIAGGAINWCCYSGSATWINFQLPGRLDGAEEESFTSGTNHEPVSPAQWRTALANEAWSEANHKLMLANADVPTSEDLSVYGVATMLLAGNGYTSWDTAEGDYNTGESWFPPFDTAVGLGAPLGAYTVQANGLYVRRFHNGVVVVNPTASAVSDPVFGTLAAQSGEIL